MSFCAHTVEQNICRLESTLAKLFVAMAPDEVVLPRISQHPYSFVRPR